MRPVPSIQQLQAQAHRLAHHAACVRDQLDALAHFPHGDGGADLPAAKRHGLALALDDAARLLERIARVISAERRQPVA